MPTRRTPINRPQRMRFTPEAIAAFRRMQRANHDVTTDEWWAAHNALAAALRSKPWEWPVVLVPDEPCPFPANCHAEREWHRRREQRPEAFALFAELTEATAMMQD